LFKFSDFYSFAHAWFKGELIGVDEEKYAEKVSGNKREISIEWKGTKELSDYFKTEYKIKFEIKDLVEVEVEIDGTKEKMNQGKIEVEIKGVLVRDHKSKWDTSAFSRFMRDVYNKYVIPSRVEDMKSIVSNNVRNFKEQLKMFLNLSGKR
jgi:hypothetical protein